MKRTRKEILRMRILIFCAVVVVIVVGAVIASKISKSQPDQYDKNRQRLEKLEKADISETEKRWTDLEEEENKTQIDESKRNEYGVVVLDNVALKKAFDNTVIVWDSFAYGILIY